jgi:putative ABC transport system ATP-binding protein
MTLAVNMRDLTHAYGEGLSQKQILFDVELEVARGEVVFLMGPSGCGKTTILTLIGALRSVQNGFLQVLGTDLAGANEKTRVETRRRIGFVFQSHNLHGSLNALENVRMGLEAQGRARDPRADALSGEMLRTVGLEGHEKKHQDKLSGGQRQRVAIARALVGSPGLLLADEPTAALDSKTGRDVVMLIRDSARQRGMAVLMVTHDSRILDLADRVIKMEDGRILPPDLARPETVGQIGHGHLQTHAA